MSDLTTFQQKLAARRAKELEAKKAAEVPTGFEDLIPEADESYERSDDDIAIDRIITGLTIDKAYDRWIRKPRPRQRPGQREGVMISCPKPNHPDKNPSAWMNLEKNTWFCAGCNEGGDVLDLAAIKFGIDNYKSGSNFRDLREAIAEDFGFTRVFAPGLPREGALVAPEPKGVQPPAPSPPPSVPAPPITPPISSTEPPVDDGPAPVSYLPGVLEEEDDSAAEVLPGLAWRELVTPDTFLDAYMAACTVDDVPEEYHFWNGLIALGLAVGRDVTLEDYHPVLGNLFICILGRTGIGKSRASSHLGRLLEEAIPEDRTVDAHRGARTMSTAGSAEVLIKNFSRPVYSTPTTPGGKPVLSHYAPVRGLVEYSELSGLIGRSARTGSTIKPTLMEFFDGKATVSNASLSNGEQIAHEPFASLLTSTQPKALKTLLDQGDADSGFLNRWVFVTGTEKPRVAIGGARVDISKPAEKLKDIWKWAEPDPNTFEQWTVEWTPESQLAFEEFFHGKIEPLKRGDSQDDDREFFQRLDLIMKKLILLFTVNEKMLKVPIEAVHKAIKVFWYLVEVLAIPSGAIGKSVQSQLEDDVVALLKKYSEKNGKDSAVPLYYITKILGKRKAYTLEMIERALKTLTNLHMLVAEKPELKGPGRPPVVRYRLATHE